MEQTNKQTCWNRYKVLTRRQLKAGMAIASTPTKKSHLKIE